MFKIKNTLSYAAVICGLLIIFTAPEKAAAQFIPPGSYQKTCKNIKAVGPDLFAECNQKVDGPFKLDTPVLKDYFECEGSIWNDNAELKCDRNTNSTLMQKAKTAVGAGYKNVMGVGVTSYPNYQKYLRLLFADGYAQKFYDGSFGGIGNLMLIPWFQTWLSKPENNSAKSSMINRAFYEVYNYGPSPKDVAFYMNSPTGFQTIVLAEQKKMNADKAVRRLMISAAYKYTMGRNPTAAEFDYWQPKPEYFMQIAEANRAFMYGGSVKGSSDLSETVKRALNKNGNNPNPDIDQINKAIAKYSVNKYIYDQMN